MCGTRGALVYVRLTVHIDDRDDEQENAQVVEEKAGFRIDVDSL